MSILDNQNESAELVANQIIIQAKQTFNSMVRAFNDGSELFWNNPKAKPQDIIKILGNNAVEIFKLHYALGQLVGQIKPESISHGLSLIGKFSMNEDGTVTILEEDKDIDPPVQPTDLEAKLINEI